MRAAVTMAQVLLALAASRAGAQQRIDPRLQLGARVDVFAARYTAVQGGGELSAAVARSLRVALTTAAGESWDHGAGLSARADLIGRFLLDPDFRRRWAPYGGGGVGLRYDRGPGWRGTMIAVVGVEGPNWSGVVPFIEAGVGGGARFGIGLRRTRSGAR